MRHYNQGETVTFEHTVTVWNNTTKVYDLTDADATYPKITIIDPKGAVKIDAASMTKISTGLYQYDYDLASAAPRGPWNVFYLTVIGSRKSIRFDSFRVV